MTLLRLPIRRLTGLTFIIVAVATWDWVIGGLILCIVLPLVWLFQQGIRRWGAGKKWPLKKLRLAIFLPALAVAALVFSQTNLYSVHTAALKISLAGRLPEGIRERHVREHTFTDYTVSAYIRCDPASLRAILEHPPFARDEFPIESYSFSRSPFSKVRSLPDAKNVFCYRRTDIQEGKGACYVYTDASFSFADIHYGVD